MSKLSFELTRWLKGTGKPNSVDGKWNINQVIEYRKIMGLSHARLLGQTVHYTKNYLGEIKQLKRNLAVRK